MCGNRRTRGIIVAISLLKKISTAIEDTDLVIYDVPGDIVCGGFVAPVKKGLVNEAYVLTSGEYMPYLQRAFPP